MQSKEATAEGVDYRRTWVSTRTIKGTVVFMGGGELQWDRDYIKREKSKLQPSGVSVTTQMTSVGKEHGPNYDQIGGDGRGIVIPLLEGDNRPKM